MPNLTKMIAEHLPRNIYSAIILIKLGIEFQRLESSLTFFFISKNLECIRLINYSLTTFCTDYTYVVQMMLQVACVVFRPLI